MGNRIFLETDCICTVHMINLMEQTIARIIMSAGLHRLLICQTGDMKESFTGKNKIRIKQGNGICMHQMWQGEQTTGSIYITVQTGAALYQWRSAIHLLESLNIRNIGFSKQRFGNYPMGNNHGSIVCIENVYCILGHRQTNRTGFSRQGIAEQITMNPDGTFNQAEYTSNGLNVEPLAGHGKYPAYITCFLTGKRIGKKHRPYVTQDGEDRDGGDNQYAAGIVDGGRVGFKYFTFLNSVLVSVLVRGQAKGSLYVTNRENGRQLGKINIDIAQKEKWVEVKTKIKIPDGVSGIYFTYRGKGILQINDFTLIENRKAGKTI